MKNNNKDINVPKKEFLKTYINFSLVLRDPLHNYNNITRFVKQWTEPKLLFQTKLLQNPDSERGQMMIKLITNLKKSREQYNLYIMKYYYYFYYELTILANSISCFSFLFLFIIF
jgi:hypothetical protein